MTAPIRVSHPHFYVALLFLRRSTTQAAGLWSVSSSQIQMHLAMWAFMYKGAHGQLKAHSLAEGLEDAGKLRSWMDTHLNLQQQPFLSNGTAVGSSQCTSPMLPAALQSSGVGSHTSLTLPCARPVTVNVSRMNLVRSPLPSTVMHTLLFCSCSALTPSVTGCRREQTASC